jgi:UDP-N-acetylglucosamine diphosphorylase / glucose-1-phosphate thymidylyltransferase / UDP-N-acetylgalactosamine diphosphorylase / glucosamine-1-phosphate N-acetyltransferase / galactosamine-1-phosphate N-acetyltransferase
MFLPDLFFDLKNFSHRSLFLLKKPIWETLKNLKSYFKELELGKIECTIPSSVTLINPDQISIGKGSIIEPGSYIEGPCVIGENCEVRHGAYIRPYVLTGKRCVLGHASELKHSILLDFACAPHFNYVGDSILGNYVNLGAGVICANVRLDRREIKIKIEENLFETGINKLGAIIGDHSQLGCNSVTNPGLLLRKKTFSRACSSIQSSNMRIRKTDDIEKLSQTEHLSSQTFKG